MAATLEPCTEFLLRDEAFLERHGQHREDVGSHHEQLSAKDREPVTGPLELRITCDHCAANLRARRIGDVSCSEVKVFLYSREHRLIRNLDEVPVALQSDLVEEYQRHCVLVAARALAVVAEELPLQRLMLLEIPLSSVPRVGIQMVLATEDELDCRGARTCQDKPVIALVLRRPREPS